MSPSNKEKRTSEKKWGKEVIDYGFCIIPSLLLHAQKRLGLTPTHLAVLLQVADYWWESDRKPYPSKRSLSERLDISERQIQRYIAELENAGLIKRKSRHALSGGRMSNEYDLAGLVKRIQALEPEFTQAAAEAKQKRRQLSKSGGLKYSKMSDTNL
jgi:hypothetical protein